MTPVVALVLALAPAQEPSAGSKVYKQVVPAVAYIRTGKASGSGTLVDKDRRLVLTNYHVIDGAERPGQGAGYDPVQVQFPEFEGTRPKTDRNYYKGKQALKGTVIAVNRNQDLAVVQLDRVPADVPEVKLAANSPGPGDPIHSIGNAGASGALWGYVRGSVRNVYPKKWKALAGNKVLTFNARVIEADSPTNPGDSGGPLLNDAGELIGVTQGGQTTTNAISYFIDISEVRRLLTSQTVVQKAGPRKVAAGKPEPKEPAKRAEPLRVRDDADFFSPAATEAADKLIAELHRQGFDVLIETHPTPPDAWKEKAKDPKERGKLYFDWAVERIKAEKADGVAVVITGDPQYFRTVISPDWNKKLPPAFVNRVADALRANLVREPDKALAEVLDVIKDAHAAATKK
jgi:V8-like Glu-specific endopeptidase